MGTRTGDIDPAVLLYLQRKTRIGVDDLDDLLNKKSGILGLSGHRDMRDLTRAAASGDETSRLALGVYVRRVKRYVGAYLAELGGADLIVFTAGIGENSSVVRERSLAGMQSLGIEIDSNRNAMPNDGPRIISTDASVVTVLVVPTNEELEIARQTLRVAE